MNQRDDQQHLSFIQPWVPMAKQLAKLFPTDRPFTEIEAVFSLQLDHNNDKDVTVLGYAKRWRWSRDRVSSFLRKCGLRVVYPENTRLVQKQLGRLQPAADQTAENSQIKFIDFSILGESTRRKLADDPTQLTRIEKKEKTLRHPDDDGQESVSSSKEEKDLFEDLWRAYPRKTHKGEAEKAWRKIKAPAETLAAILKALDWQKKSDQWIGNNGQYIPYPSTYLKARGWEDEKPKEQSFSQTDLFGTCKKCRRPNIELIHAGLCAECTRTIKWGREDEHDQQDISYPSFCQSSDDSP
jgi:hypothetical protein